MSEYGQDWNVKVLRKKGLSKKETIKTAERKGKTVEVKKNNAVGQKKFETPSLKALKDEEDLTDFKHAKIDHSFRIALQKARMDKNLTQTELAQKINVKPNIINSYEAGTAIPNQNLISLLQRVLGVKLPPVQKK